MARILMLRITVEAENLEPWLLSMPDVAAALVIRTSTRSPGRMKPPAAVSTVTRMAMARMPGSR